MKISGFKTSALLTLLLLLGGCDAGTGEGLDENGAPLVNEGDTPEMDMPSNLDATLENVNQQVFAVHCVECHAGANAPLGLRLDSVENSFSLLVNQSSQEVPQFLRVDPGSPDLSYLMKKIEGTRDIVGGQMPLRRPPLTQEKINLVRQWISDGAMP